MVAKINLGNSLSGVLAYNQKKVDAGEAKIVCSNLIRQTYGGDYEPALALQSFEHYLRVNKKTENPVVHILII